MEGEPGCESGRAFEIVGRLRAPLELISTKEGLTLRATSQADSAASICLVRVAMVADFAFSPPEKRPSCGRKGSNLR